MRHGFPIFQEAFESKQASMFIALEKLFALQNAMLLESRIIKAFILYTASIFIVYMFTSTKQTYTIRARLYVGTYVLYVLYFSYFLFCLPVFLVFKSSIEGLNRSITSLNLILVHRSCCHVSGRSSNASAHNK